MQKRKENEKKLKEEAEVLRQAEIEKHRVASATKIQTAFRMWRQRQSYRHIQVT